MSRRSSKARKRGKIRHVKELPRAEHPTAPLAERCSKHFHLDGERLGNGLEELDVSILTGGQVNGSAHINRLEASALDGLKKAGVLDDPNDSTAAFRRHMAGVLLRDVFQGSGMESRSTGRYDKALNEMVPSGTRHPQSHHELNHEVEYFRLVKLCGPFAEVVRRVCCYNERPPEIVRSSSLSRPVGWREALRRGLDMIAEDQFSETDRRPRRRSHSRLAPLEKA